MKERLTGAIILVALMVWVIPELLTGPIRSAPRAAALASRTGEPPLRSYTIDLGDESHARAATERASGPQQPAPLLTSASAESPAAEPSAVPEAPHATTGSAAPPALATPPAPVGASHGPPPVTPVAPRSSTTRALSAAAPAQTQAAGATIAGKAAASAASGAWVVQLGSFARRENAERLAQHLRSQGFEVSVSQGSGGRRLYRVRVGAAHDRAGALALAQKLRALGHSGTVVPKQAGA